MACYLVDYENVNQKGINGINQLKLTENDSVIIYYSNNANSLTFELHKELMRSNAKIEYRKITNEGKNALDFILVCDLGGFVALKPEEHYYIVSKDNDYDNVIKYITGHYKCTVEKIKSIAQNTNASKNEAALRETESELCGLVENDEIEKVQATIDKYVTKNAIHNNLVKLFGERGKVIYENIKPLLKNKK